MSDVPESQTTTLRPPVLPSTNSEGSHFSTHHENLVRPFRFFHPTRADFTPHPSIPKTGARPPHASHWSSRASRKNRFTLDVFRVRHHRKELEKGLTGLVPVKQRLQHPGSKLKVHLAWDISFWVAVLFVLGSTVWVGTIFLCLFRFFEVNRAAW